MNRIERFFSNFEGLQNVDMHRATKEEAYRISIIKIFNRVFGDASTILTDALRQQAGVVMDDEDPLSFYQLCVDNELITDASLWVQMQADRNTSLFVYDDKAGTEIIVRVFSKYVEELGNFAKTLRSHFGI